MGVIRLQNNGKNLFPTIIDLNTQFKVLSLSKRLQLNNIVIRDEDKNAKIAYINGRFIQTKAGTVDFYGIVIILSTHIGQQYTLSLKNTSNVDIQAIIQNPETFALSPITNIPAGENIYSSGTFTATNTKTFITIECKAIPEYWEIWDIQIEKGSSATEYEPPRNDYLEFDTELFAYNGVADELHDDGTLIKRWNRESITITSGAGTITKSGRGTCILVADTDGVPYEGTVSGTSVTTNAPDGAYTVIYQLATPEIIDLNYDGELILYPGENNLILPDLAVASISGSRKYLEG